MQYVSETFWICLKDVLKTCYQEQINLMIRLENVLKTLEDVLKMSWRYLEDGFARRLVLVRCLEENVLKKTSWRRLEDVLKTYGQDEYISLDQDVLKTSSEDVWLRWIYLSWSKRLKMSSENERRLQDVLIKTNVCWIIIIVSSW